ncbi:RND family transporter [Porphyromonas sp.]|uniref:efflux RND transporter permease subunit n=1 Tax=Porphyromonas sp. TaxID=1924944 RepID=UPI0026DCEE1C|nr:MMPL family transporter [Porphyromonas sp.]MDO4695437.1 MMPL family transporter [Porphyromonas sp.]MDO4771248.1 MMPL family transporter [Porphyromonas sp.]
MKIERINRWFRRLGEKIIRGRWWVLGSFVLLVAIGLNGARFLNIKTSWEDYFLEDDPLIIRTEEFKSIFGNDNYAAVLVECDNVFTKSNLELIRRLSNEMLDSISYADKITSLTDIEFMVGNEDGMTIEQIVPEEIPSDPEKLEEIRKKAFLKPHIARRLISQDKRLTWILLKLRPFPSESEWGKTRERISPEAVTGRELEKIIKKAEYAPLNPKGTGMPYLAERKIVWINKEIPVVMGIAVILALIVLALSTRSLRGTLVPIITAISSIIMAYGVTGYLRLEIDSGMIMIPMLLAFAVAVAYNIHIHSYFRRQMRLHGKRKLAAIETIEETGWPILFSALTTFAALLSFLAIPVVPMHFVGIATSSSVMFSFLIAMMVMPTTLSIGKDRAPQQLSQQNKKHCMDRMLENFGAWVLAHEKTTWAIAIAITAVMIYGFTKMETAFDVDRTMGRRVEYVRDLIHVGESELGSLYSYDIMVNLPNEGDAKLPEHLKALDLITQKADSFALTKRTTSILNILKDLNQTLHNGEEKYYSIPDDADEIAQQLLLYENAGGSEVENWIDYEYKRLRLNVELHRYNSGEAEDELREITEYAQEVFPTAKITPVGSLPQFTSMMQYVVHGQMSSFLISLIIIGILMMIVFGSVRVGLIGLIPNIMPAIVVGGLMGLLNYPLDMMTATIMPMILGLAVDDTIHFFNHGHLEFDRQRNYRRAILKSFRIVGTPIVLTSLIVSANFAAYTISEGSSFVHMGILSVAGMFTALLADLCITPLLFRRFKIFGKEGEVIEK